MASRTVTFKDVNGNILDTQIINDGENASLSNIHKTGKLITNLSEDHMNINSDRNIIVTYVDEQGVEPNNALPPFTEWTGQWEAIDIERKANSVSLNTTTAWGGIYTDYPSELLNKDIMFNISAMSSNASLVIQDATDYSALLELTNENRSGTINLTSNSNIRIVFQDDSNTGTIWLTDLWACDVNYLPTVLIAKYKFDNTLYNLIPEFNSGFTDYTYTDEVDGEVTTRTIYSKHLPTIVRFGTGNASSTNRENSLLEILELKTDNLITMSYMFANCENLTYINSSNWNTSNVTEMIWLFVRCYSLRTIEGINNWDTSKVTNMDSTVNDCSSLTSLDLSNWNTSNVTDMGWMFYNCNSLSSLDLSNWNTANVDYIAGIFSGCSSLKEITMYNSDVNSINEIISVLPTRTTDNPGSLYLGNTDLTNVNTSDAEAKYWIILKHKGSVINIKVGNSNVTKMLLSNNRVKNIYIGDDK